MKVSFGEYYDAHKDEMKGYFREYYTAHMQEMKTAFKSHCMRHKQAILKLVHYDCTMVNIGIRQYQLLEPGMQKCQISS